MFGLFGGETFKPEQDIPALAGKVILVTGGNTGLGYESVLQLAKHEPKEIYLAARTESKALKAIEEIKAAVPNAAITFLKLDLTDFKSVESAAKEFTSKSDRLDILLNNAGVMALPYSKTAQGYEIQFGTNHMGHALLTKLLLPTLVKTAAEAPDSDVRIINLSSAGHQLAPSGGIVFNQDALETYGTWARYGATKLANILHARVLSAKYPQITCAAVHPGVILTDLYASSQQSSFIVRWGLKTVGSLAMRDVHYGALNQLWASTVSKEKVRQSIYWVPVGSASAGSAYARDEKLAQKLWDYTEEELKKHGY
ncbi:hypothetical protein AAFC00_002657 [Neodothiora populina]|uniref:Short-chain dehydrogenase/reductase n=1 Tax=Neodothiora populina TaxID=2781224 RepID=A0ABR3P7U6_9PEZI